MPTTGTNATIHGGGFHHIALRVYDFDASLKFYIDGLGFKRTYGWGKDGRADGEGDSRAAMLDTGDGNYLEVFAGGKRKHGEPAPDGPFFHIALRSASVPAAFERAVAAGGVPTVEPKKVVPPHADEPAKTFHVAFVLGPDGESVEFFDNDTL